MRPFVRNTVVALLLTAVAAPLAAQDIRPMSSGPQRAGFWWGIGLGSAQADVKCPGCIDVDPENFPMGDLHLGVTLSPKLTLGLQATGGQKTNGFLNDPNIDENVGDVNVSAYFYPSAAGNFFLQGGLAGVVFRGKNGSSTDTYTGAGLVLGAGYDFRFGRNASITPSIRGVFGGKADVKNQDGAVDATDWQTSFIHVGVSVIWH
jgi:hypothetical protein